MYWKSRRKGHCSSVLSMYLTHVLRECYSKGKEEEEKKVGGKSRGNAKEKIEYTVRRVILAFLQSYA